MIKIGPGRIAHGEFIDVAAARCDRKARMTICGIGHDHAVPVHDAGVFGAVDELDAHALATPELERRTEVPGCFAHRTRTTADHLGGEAQDTGFRAAPDRHAGRRSNQPDRDIGRLGSECRSSAERKRGRTDAEGHRPQHLAADPVRILRVIRSYRAIHDLRSGRYRRMVSTTSGRSHSAGPV